MRIHRRAWKQERDFFLFFPAHSARPSRSRARQAMSELGLKIHVKTHEEKRTAPVRDHPLSRTATHPNSVFNSLSPR